MDCLQWQVPPIPQLLTIGYGVWRPGMQHFSRSFGLYDVLLVRKGSLYIEEDGHEYVIGPNYLLVLEPGKTHVGFRPCEEYTEIFWLHVKHDIEQKLMQSDEIPWSLVIHKISDQETHPSWQSCYIPKFGCYPLDDLWPLLEEMVKCYDRLTIGTVWQLQSLFVQLLGNLQRLVRRSESDSRSGRLATAVSAYLRSHATDERMKVEVLEREFHYHSDYITRCLKRHTGMSPLEYLRHIRVEQARRLLEHSPELSIKQIAEAVGVPDANYFCRMFRKEIGVPPGIYRKRYSGYI